MNQKKLKKGCIFAIVAYLILAVAFYLIGGEQLHYRDEQTEMLTANEPIGEITAGQTIEQKISVSGGQLTGVTFLGATYARQNSGKLQIAVYSSSQKLGEQSVDIASIVDGAEFTVNFAPPIHVPDERAELKITAPESMAGNAVTLYVGNTMSASRTQIEVKLTQEERVRINGNTQNGALCLRVQSRETLWFGTYYWYIVVVLLVVLLLFCWHLLRADLLDRHSIVLNIFAAFTRYRYLMKQLVSRDFKTKYKRSVLGVLWSFLNPLLTMMVQYVIFSTLFKSGIPNFAVYLLTGIVCFNFFSEATTMALSSIIGNASLITKVYVPKYIYPLTRVMSSSINFGLSLIPLLGVLLITHTAIRPAILLLPFGALCLFSVALGVGLLLSSAMVFFRDTQFLWGVMSMLWMYMTPIFYPENIIPEKFMMIYKMNPLYHIIRFIRITLIDGVSPEPKAYVLCLLVAIIPLLIGAVIFKKSQNKFVLNL